MPTQTKPTLLTKLEVAPATQFHDPTCPLCHHRERTTFFTEGKYQVVSCAECSLVYVTPQRVLEALLDDVYSEHYWASESPKAHGYADYRRDARNYLRSFRRRAKVVARH